MATDNPKISGYVPQEIFDCLLEFKEKRSLKSVSLALTVLLSEYFQVDYKVDRQSSLLSGSDFVSRAQFEALETKLSELSSNLLGELDKLVEQKFSSFRSELLLSSPKSIEVQTTNVETEPQEDNSHLQLDIIESTLDNIDLEVDSQSSQLISKQSDFILSEPSESLSGQRLANRLKITTSTLSTKKKELLEQDFYSWLQTKDPDKIFWRAVGGDLKVRVKAWIPTEDTPSELLSRLKKWVDANLE